MPIDTDPRDALPALARPDYEAVARSAAPEKPGDPAYRGAVAREAMALDPLRSIRLHMDQVMTRADSVRRGDPWPYPGTFREFVDASLVVATRERDVLRTAADAADAVIADAKKQLTALDDARAAASTSPAPAPPTLPADDAGKPADKGDDKPDDKSDAKKGKGR